VEEEEMARVDDAASSALERVGAGLPVKRRPAITVAALARPAGRIAGLLMLEVLQNPRARTSALRLARSLAIRLADRRSDGPATELTVRRVIAVEESVAGRVLVRRVETAIVVLGSKKPFIE
jgi:hypothetical protein